MICNTCNKQYLFENINEQLKLQNICLHCRQKQINDIIYIIDKINTKKSFESKEELQNAVQNFNNKSIVEKYRDGERYISYGKININNDYMICNTYNKQYLFENINDN